jgi:ribosomal protein S17E
MQKQSFEEQLLNLVFDVTKVKNFILIIQAFQDLTKFRNESYDFKDILNKQIDKIKREITETLENTIKVTDQRLQAFYDDNFKKINSLFNLLKEIEENLSQFLSINLTKVRNDVTGRIVNSIQATISFIKKNGDVLIDTFHEEFDEENQNNTEIVQQINNSFNLINSFNNSMPKSFFENFKCEETHIGHNLRSKIFDKIKSIGDEISKSRDTFKIMERKISTLKDDLNAHEDKLQSLNNSLNRTILEKKTEETREEISRNEVKVIELKRTIDELNKKKDENENKIKECKKEIDDKQMEFKKLMTSISNNFKWIKSFSINFVMFKTEIDQQLDKHFNSFIRVNGGFNNLAKLVVCLKENKSVIGIF